VGDDELAIVENVMTDKVVNEFRNVLAEILRLVGKADAADTEAVRLAVAKTIGTFGAIDILS